MFVLVVSYHHVHSSSRVLFFSVSFVPFVFLFSSRRRFFGFRFSLLMFVLVVSYNYSDFPLLFCTFSSSPSHDIRSGRPFFMKFILRFPSYSVHSHRLSSFRSHLRGFRLLLSLLVLPRFFFSFFASSSLFFFSLWIPPALLTVLPHSFRLPFILLRFFVPLFSFRPSLFAPLVLRTFFSSSLPILPTFLPDFLPTFFPTLLPLFIQLFPSFSCLLNTLSPHSSSLFSFTDIRSPSFLYFYHHLLHFFIIIFPRTT